MDLCSQCDFPFPLALSTKRICFQISLARQLPFVPISARVRRVLPRFALLLTHDYVPLAVGLLWLMRPRLNRHFSASRPGNASAPDPLPHPA